MILMGSGTSVPMSATSFFTLLSLAVLVNIRPSSTRPTQLYKTWWPETWPCFSGTVYKVSCSVYATVHVYTRQVYFTRYQKNTVMYNGSTCSITLKVLNQRFQLVMTPFIPKLYFPPSENSLFFPVFPPLYSRLKQKLSYFFPKQPIS